MTSEGDEPRPADDPLTSEQRRAAQRRRATVILSSVVTIAVVAAVVVWVALSHSSTSTPPVAIAAQSSAPTGSSSGSPAESPTANRTSIPIEPAVRADLTGVPATVEAAVGQGDSAALMKPVKGPAITTAGKPTLLYVGGLFCPFCAAERWSIVQALSRFGTFTGVTEIRSSEDDLATFDLEKAVYTSNYLAFLPKEIESQREQPLQRLTASQQAVFKTYGGSSFPFIYVDGKYAQSGAGYNPAYLEGLQHSQIASQLRDANSPLTKSIIGEANELTAAICGVTSDQPTAVCGNATISGIQARMDGAVSS